MNTPVGLFLSCLLFALSAHGARDPFWPIGWSPDLTNKAAKVAAPLPAPVEAKPLPPPPPPPPKPVSDKEWQDAQKELHVNGITQALRNGELVVQVMIARKIHVPGDILCVTNDNVRYTWELGNSKGLELNLKPLKAERLEK